MMRSRWVSLPLHGLVASAHAWLCAVTPSVVLHLAQDLLLAQQRALRLVAPCRRSHFHFPLPVVKALVL